MPCSIATTLEEKIAALFDNIHRRHLSPHNQITALQQTLKQAKSLATTLTSKQKATNATVDHAVQSRFQSELEDFRQRLEDLSRHPRPGGKDLAQSRATARIAASGRFGGHSQGTGRSSTRERDAQTQHGWGRCLQAEHRATKGTRQITGRVTILWYHC